MTSVLVCDDEPATARAWVEEVREGSLPASYQLRDVPDVEQIQDAIRTLLARRNALRAGTPWPAEACLFDELDVLVIDYDLLHVDQNNTRYTGEGVARLARVYARCGPILVLNQYLESQFDLSLRGHLESHADLNLDSRLIVYPGLWKAGAEGFCPWHWPVLSEAADAFAERVQELLEPGALQRGLLDIVNMSEEDASRLSDTAFGFVAPEAKSYEALAATTLAAFLTNNSSAVDTRDGAKLVEAQPEACARIVAARISKWLEREVLGPQDVLVDIPHLIQRCPFMLAGNVDDPAAWNAAIYGGRDAVKLVPDDAWFAAEHWLSRPAVWWRRLESDPAFRQAREEFEYTDAEPQVFLEDTSRFASLEEATEFRAGFHNAFDRRYAAKVEGIRYAPQRRFAFGD